MGALTWNGELISTVPHGSPLSPERPAVADFRVTTWDTRTMHKGPEADAFPVVSCNTKPFHPISVKYSLHTFHVLWDLEGDDTLGSMPSHCMPWLYSSRI